jgi:hypothetical protein
MSHRIDKIANLLQKYIGCGEGVLDTEREKRDGSGRPN